MQQGAGPRSTNGFSSSFFYSKLKCKVLMMKEEILKPLAKVNGHFPSCPFLRCS